MALDGARCTVRLDGELDLITVAQLQGVLRRVCEGGHRLVIIDLGALRFVSLAGLHALVEAQQTLHTGGCRLVLAHPDTSTVRVLAITGLDQLLHLQPEHEQPGSEAAPTPPPIPGPIPGPGPGPGPGRGRRRYRGRGRGRYRGRGGGGGGPMTVLDNRPAGSATGHTNAGIGAPPGTNAVPPAKPVDSRGQYTHLEPLLARYAAMSSGDPRRRALRDELVAGFFPVVEHIARRYHDRGEPKADLEQVGAIGLLGALERFDPGRGADFLSFAVPTITGEIRRHFRDRTWSMRVPRRLKDLQGPVRDATATLFGTLGRAPKPSEIAAHSRRGGRSDHRSDQRPARLHGLLPRHTRRTTGLRSRRG